MRKLFSSSETRPAGYVFPIPLSARHIRDDKPVRPFLLLNRVSGDGLGTLALMTTKRTEALHGATLFELEDRRGKQPLPGQEHSYVDLTSLLFRRGDALLLSDQHHARHLPGIRNQLHVALGIGSGVGPGRPGQSIRGHLVQLGPEIARAYGFEFGIVLTEHGYSSARRLQALVPVVDVRAFLGPEEAVEDFVPLDSDVVPLPEAAWTRQLPGDWAVPVVDTVRLASFTERWEENSRPRTWLSGQIVRVFPSPIDGDTLARIERAVEVRLTLP